jgi:hypothetical protein
MRVSIIVTATDHVLLHKGILWLTLIYKYITMNYIYPNFIIILGDTPRVAAGISMKFEDAIRKYKH